VLGSQTILKHILLNNFDALKKRPVNGISSRQQCQQFLTVIEMNILQSSKLIYLYRLLLGINLHTYVLTIAVKIYNAASSLVRFENENFFFYFEICSSPCLRWRCM
jgi:hypothetical protein